MIGDTSAPLTSNLSVAAQSVTEVGFTNMSISFLATDPDGIRTINDSTANVTIRRQAATGGLPDLSAYRTGNCIRTANFNSTMLNESCYVQIWYWDPTGTWVANVSIQDNFSTPNLAAPLNVTFSLAESTCMVLNPKSLNFGTVSLGQTNKTSSNSPILLNNTCNRNVTTNNINVTAIDLIGDDAVTQFGSSNFTIWNTTGGSPTAECLVTPGSQMVNGTAVNLTNAQLPAGNNSAPSTSINGTQPLYTCITKVPSTLVQQTYSANLTRAWTVSIF